jgi:hypothetical protein
MTIGKMLSMMILALLPFSSGYAQCSPVHVTALEARQRMMDLLHIDSIRPAFSGSPTGKNPANFDEAKAGPFSQPPDPLVLNDGRQVTTPQMWWNERRPQIEADFSEDVLGRVPKNIPPVHWEVASVTREMNGDVPVISKKLVGHVDNSACPAIQVNINLTFSTPANAKGPVPVIMEMDLDAKTLALFAKRFANTPKPKGPTWRQQVLAKGWDMQVTSRRAFSQTTARARPRESSV